VRPDAILVLGDTNSALSVIAAKRRKFRYFISKQEIAHLISALQKK
jgi:UDP-N-acetylglucosamine 2-epimerase